MSDPTENTYLIPKLRFPEFHKREGFERTALNKLLFETKTRNREGKFGKEHVLSVSGVHGCVNQIKLLGRSYAGVSIENYHVLETHDVVYTKSPLKQNPYGIIKENKSAAGIVSTLYAVYRATDDCEPSFLDHYFSSDYNLNSYLQPLVNKGAKNDMKVKNSDVLLGEIYAPKIDEQQKIANCLSSLDDLISAEGEELDTLRDHKKGLMQKLFPAEGKTTPEFRFPGFQDAAEWRLESLGSLVKFASGGTPSKNNSKFWNGTIPWISAASMYDTDIRDSERMISQAAVEAGARIAKSGTLLLLIRGSMLFKKVPMGIAGLDVAFNQDVKALTVSNEVNTNFLLKQLMSFEKRFPVSKTGIGAGKIDTNDLEDFGIYLPSRDEQKCIADCLVTLDSRINSQVDKINSLADHKKGLMQGLFPSDEEVSA